MTAEHSVPVLFPEPSLSNTARTGVLEPPSHTTGFQQFSVELDLPFTCTLGCYMLLGPVLVTDVDTIRISVFFDAVVPTVSVLLINN